MPTNRPRYSFACHNHRCQINERMMDKNVHGEQSRGLFVLERLFRVVNVIGFDDQRDRNVFTVGPGLSDVFH